MTCLPPVRVRFRFRDKDKDRDRVRARVKARLKVRVASHICRGRKTSFQNPSLFM